MISALLLSLHTTAAASIALLFIGVPLGWLFSRRQFPGKSLLETALNLPLVLPPSVVGYYLLLILGRGGPVESASGVNLVFTWWATAMASAVVGMPLMFNAARIGFASVDQRLEQAARTLGASEWDVFRRVTLPLAQRGVWLGLLLGSLRAMGEFGASMMVAGNIPGRTQTMPLALYDAIQRSDPVTANALALVLTALAFAGLVAVRALERPFESSTGG